MTERRRLGQHEQTLNFSPRSNRDSGPSSSNNSSRCSSTRSILPELQNLSIPEPTWTTARRRRIPYPSVPQLTLSQNSSSNTSPQNAESFLRSPRRATSPRSPQLFGLPGHAARKNLGYVNLAELTERDPYRSPRAAQALSSLTRAVPSASDTSSVKQSPGREKRQKKVGPRSSRQHKWPDPQNGSPPSSQRASSNARSSVGSSPIRLSPRLTLGTLPIRKSPRSGPPALRKNHLPRPPSRRISMGIEVECELAAKGTDLARENIEDFAAAFAKRFNDQRQAHQVPMKTRLREYDEMDYRKWCLVEETTVNMNDTWPWGIELVTPILTAIPGSIWREDVSSMWRFIHQNYNMTHTFTCATHIHVCLDPPIIVTELRRLCSAIIHFEPAIWALLPANRRSNIYARNNWLHSQFLAQEKRSRPESIAFLGRQATRADLIRAMQPNGDRDLAWNLSPLTSPGKGTIEFRAPGPSLNAEDCLAWAEFVMTFVRASLACSSSKVLQAVPPTVGGLRSFLACPAARVSEVSQPDRLKRIWGTLDGDAWVEPEDLRTMDGELPFSMRLLLEEMLAKDRARIGRFTGVSGLQTSMLGLRRSRTLSRLDHLGALGT